MKIVHDLGEGIHKLGRIILAAVTVTILGWVKINLPDINTEDLLFIAAPALTYIGIKGKGYQAKKPDLNPVTEEDFK
jgi:hypothetical protein